MEAAGSSAGQRPAEQQAAPGSMTEAEQQERKVQALVSMIECGQAPTPEQMVLYEDEEKVLEIAAELAADAAQDLFATSPLAQAVVQAVSGT